MYSRRGFLSMVMLAALAPAVHAAEESGLKDLLGGIADAATRRYAEKYSDDGRWDGKYYYDRYDNRRYTRDEWRREIERRARYEREGRDWRDDKRRAWEEKRYGKNYRNFRNDRGDGRRPGRDDERNRRQDEKRARDERRREEARQREDRNRQRRNDERVRRNDERVRREDERRSQDERRRDAARAVKNLFN